MHANRIEAMRQVATNLLFEGQTSRADAVLELIREVERLQGLLGPDYCEDEDEGCWIRGILVKEEAELERCMCSSYCGETSPAIIDHDLCADSIEALVEVAARQLPVHLGNDAPGELFIVGRNLTEGLRDAFALRVEEAKAKQREAERAKAQAAHDLLVRRAEARIAELSSGAALEEVRANLKALRERGA